MSMLMMLVALVTVALAADSDNKGKSADGLQEYADRAACNIDFHSKIVSGTADKVPQASALKDWASKLSSDEAQLTNLAAAGDADAFHKFVKESLTKDLKAADAAVRNERKNFKAYNITEGTKEALKNDYKIGHDAFVSCEKQNNLKVAQQRVNVYSHFLSQRQDEVEKLAKRNIGTTELSALITQAQNTIVTPLQDAVSSGDAEKATAALKQYCLMEGCKNGTNFHFAAKFEQARLATLLAQAKPDADAAGLSSQLAKIQGSLDESKSALQLVGTADFKGTQQNQVWNSAKSAAEALRKLHQDINAAKKAVMEKKKEERQAQRSNITANRPNRPVDNRTDTAPPRPPGAAFNATKNSTGDEAR